MSHIEQFCESAIAKGDDTSAHDNEHFEAMKCAINNLSDLSELVPLLTHNNEWVVCWSAGHLLVNGQTSKAVEALKILVQKGGISGFSAEVVIQEFERGTFVSPFVYR